MFGTEFCLLVSLFWQQIYSEGYRGRLGVFTSIVIDLWIVVFSGDIRCEAYSG